MGGKRGNKGSWPPNRRPLANYIRHRTFREVMREEDGSRRLGRGLVVVRWEGRRKEDAPVLLHESARSASKAGLCNTAQIEIVYSTHILPHAHFATSSRSVPPVRNGLHFRLPYRILLAILPNPPSNFRSSNGRANEGRPANKYRPLVPGIRLRPPGVVAQTGARAVYSTEKPAGGQSGKLRTAEVYGWGNVEGSGKRGEDVRESVDCRNSAGEGE